jgi:L-rhamnose mutarotase
MTTLKATASTTAVFAGACLLGMGANVVLQRYLRQKQKGNHNLNESLPAPRRIGAAIKLKREQYRRYRELHDNVWDAVLERMYQSNIRNFVIYYHEETSTMFQSFDWIGHWKTSGGHALSHEKEQRLFESDMAAVANDPVTRQWWNECEPCQQPFAQWKAGSTPPSQGGTGDWWAPMECLCHTGHWPTAYSQKRRDPDFVKLLSD